MKIKLSWLAMIAVILICPGSVFAQSAPEVEDTQVRQARRISLAEGIALVLKDSRLVKIALPDDDAAYQDSLMARSALLPQLNGVASQNYYRYQPESKLSGTRVRTSERHFSSYGLEVYQTLYDFGKSLANYQAAKGAYLARKINTESIKRLAVLEFIIAYFDILESEQMIKVFAQEAQSLTAYLNDMEHLFQQGSIVKSDLLPVKVRLADAKQKLIEARNNRECAAARLNNILALPLDQDIEAADIKMQPSKLSTLNEIWNIAQEQRPEIDFLENQIQASVLSGRAKAVENFPVIYADAGYAYTQNKYQVHENNAYVGVGAKIDLYDGGLARAELSKERLRQGQLKEQKNKLVEDIKLEIESSYLGLKNAGEKVLVAQEALGQADENVRVNRARYASGSATSTEVLEAITLQTAAQTNYSRDDYELKRSYAKLMYSMGVDLPLVYERMEMRKNE